MVFATSTTQSASNDRDETMTTGSIPKPDSRYGVSKVFGEALGSRTPTSTGMEVVCVRIGNVNPRPMDKRRLSIWLSPRDLAQLVFDRDRPAGHPLRDRLRGLGNRPAGTTMRTPMRLGYAAQDDSEAWAEEILNTPCPAPIRARRNPGRTFVLAEDGGDPTRARCWRRVREEKKKERK